MRRTRRTARAARAACLGRPRSAFTLTEVLVGIAIIGIVLSISGIAYRRLTDSSVLAQARNAVLTYAQVARSYAVVNHTETMLAVNPFNGRFEIWYLHPPAQGGAWDPLSSGTDTTEPWKTNGYLYAPVLDASARLPQDGDGRPAALVSPIDYDDSVYRPTSGPLPDERYMDNLIWAAFCFDEHGDLVIRTRRIATRSYRRLNGAVRPAVERNRLVDESPDLSLAGPNSTRPFVMGGASGDTPITSTRGFVLSDRSDMESVLGSFGITAPELVINWLIETRPGGRYADSAATVVLNRFSGDELAGDF